MRPKVGDFVKYRYGAPYGIVLRFISWPVGRNRPPIPSVVIDKGGGRESVLPIEDTVVINRGGYPVNQGKALRSARRKAAKLSEAYRMGYSTGMAAFSRAGTTNLSPSINDKRDWRHSWREFMAGWQKAQRDWWK